MTGHAQLVVLEKKAFHLNKPRIHDHELSLDGSFKRKLSSDSKMLISISQADAYYLL